MIRPDFLPLARPHITDEEVKAVSEVVLSGHWTTGPRVRAFEEALAEYLRSDQPLYAVGLTSCTAGLHLALVALGIGAGDEVIVPTWTFAATAEVVEWTGATVVLCDVEEDSLNINTASAERLVTPRTKAIIPVHIAGYPCDLEGVTRLAKQHGLAVIEDAAHAVGTRYKGRKIGDSAGLTVFSFYATKNLAMGEGGLVVSRNRDLIEKIRQLSYFGINKEAFKRYEKSGNWFYDIEALGYKYNLDDMHAALGLAQLSKLDRMNERRRQIAEMYRKRITPAVRLPKDSGEHYHIYHLFPIRIDTSLMNRDELILALKKRNIGASVHYIPLHLHSYYRNRFPEHDFPVANGIYPEILSIPLFPSMTDVDVAYVADAVNDLLEN